MAVAERAVIAGVGMVPFTGASAGGTGLVERAVRAALCDAGLDAELIDQAVASHAYGDSRPGERGLALAGIAGIPVFNLGNGDASGSSALFHARQALLSGEAECALAVGFEEIEPAAAGGRLRIALAQLDWLAVERGIGEETFARVALKSRAHAAANPYAMRRDLASIDELRAAPVLAGRLRRAHLSAPGRGAAAVILCTGRFAARHGLRDDVVVAAHALEGGDPAAVDLPELLAALGRQATRRVAERAYEAAGIDPCDVDVAEVHDCSVGNELISCAALGLCGDDEIERFVAAGENTYGGRVVVSPSGGLLAMGDAPGANGLAQVCELAWQLRGEAGVRQVAGARTALQHDGGPGGAVAVALLQRRR